MFGDTFLEETVGLMETLPELLGALGLETGAYGGGSTMECSCR